MTAAPIHFRSELFSSPLHNFKQHIESEGNHRILFSGKFGIGKSTFLRYYFDSENQKKYLNEQKYTAYHLYPVNYVIAGNEDIFQYIKYDIIQCLLEKQIEFTDTDFKHIDALPYYVRKNILKVLATIISMIPKVGKDLSNIFIQLNKFWAEFEKHAKTVTQSSGDKLIAYIDAIEEKEGSLFENNIVTQLICSVLKREKEKSGKENVLIIDDLDRIDPEHIFRLLNVFAAHLDGPEGLPNKLGFDKVILVCDVNNLRHIFKAKFGGETDFNGYIDKFYSVEVYHLDNRTNLINIAHHVFQNIDLYEVDTTRMKYQKTILFNPSNLCIELLAVLIKYNFVNLRTLIKRTEHKIKLNAYKHVSIDGVDNITLIEIPLLAHYKILLDIVGGTSLLREYFQRLPISSFNVSHLNKYCNQLLYILNLIKFQDVPDRVSVALNNQSLYFEVNQSTKYDFNNLLVVTLDYVNSSNKVQYHYTKEEFSILFLEFIDLAERIDL